MDWEENEFPLGNRSGVDRLPSLFDSSEIDSQVASRKSAEDEIIAGADMINPIHLLSDHFPHIIARIVEFWGREKDFDDYMGHLVIKDKNSRVGFPRPIMGALIEVWNDHRDRFHIDRLGRCQWENDSSLHKAFKKLEKEIGFIRRGGLSGLEAASLDNIFIEQENIDVAQAWLFARKIL